MSTVLASSAAACAAVTGLSDYRFDDAAPSGDGGSSGAEASGTSSSSGVAPRPPDPTAYVRARCALQRKCLPAQYTAFFASDLDCENDAREDATEEGATQAQLDACAAKLAGATCEQRERDLPECDFDPPGTLPNGASCSSSRECASERCQRGDSGPCGVCAARVGENGACTASSFGGGAECETHLYCTDEGKCAKRAGEGQACALGGTACLDPFTCASSKCKKQVGLGGACTTTFGSECRSGLSCVNDRCVENVYTKTIGAQCGFNENPRVECVGLDCVDEKCAAYLKAGEACDNSDETKPGCGSGLSCQNDVCGPRPPQSPTPVCP